MHMYMYMHAHVHAHVHVSARSARVVAPFLVSCALPALLRRGSRACVVDAGCTQTHFWPRGSTWDAHDDGYAPSMVAPCPAERRAGGEGAILHVRTHRVPEIVDLRAQRGNRRTRFGAAWRSSRDIPTELYRHLAADADGKTPCMRGSQAGQCTSCAAGGATERLCECALRGNMVPRSDPALEARRARFRNKINPLSLMTRPDFDAWGARQCCLHSANYTSGTVHTPPLH